jgi:hypothetical protein
MYTVEQINDALEKFARFTQDERARAAIAEMLLAGELEVIGIVDGEFVWRAKSHANDPHVE